MDASGKKAKLGEVGKWIIEDGENVPLDVKQAFLLPAWYDEKKFKRGQKYFADNYFSLFVAKLCGLLVVLAVPSILRVLVLTGQSSHPVSAFRRYLDTLSHMLEWYEGDVMNPNSSIVSQFYLILSHMLEWYEVDVKNSNSGYVFVHFFNPNSSIVSQLCLILSHVLRWYEEDVMNPNSSIVSQLCLILSHVLRWYEEDVMNPNSSQLCLILSHVLRWYEEDVMNPNSRYVFVHFSQLIRVHSHGSDKTKCINIISQFDFI
ncbi:hypothetical protein J6590_095190 [Homalodisca vitripennis]|nr:hypothetical protein J6590_095190 [Homalodisca vitripennis]